MLVDKGRYQRLVSKLIYLSHTRPDIAFVVSQVSQHMDSPIEDHMEVYRILRYLITTPAKGLFFRKNEERGVKIYTNADYDRSKSERHSTTRYCSYA